MTLLTVLAIPNTTYGWRLQVLLKTISEDLGGLKFLKIFNINLTDSEEHNIT